MMSTIVDKDEWCDAPMIKNDLKYFATKVPSETLTSGDIVKLSESFEASFPSEDYVLLEDADEKKERLAREGKTVL